MTDSLMQAARSGDLGTRVRNDDRSRCLWMDLDQDRQAAIVRSDVAKTLRWWRINPRYRIVKSVRPNGRWYINTTTNTAVWVTSSWRYVGKQHSV